MTEQYKPNIGNEPEPRALRDAIHLAVAPVIAGENLYPGERVGFKNGDYRTAYRHYPGAAITVTPIGIVDPFLERKVLKGKSFWLFLFPNTITGLRHMWSHPAFTVKLPLPATERTEDKGNA